MSTIINIETKLMEQQSHRQYPENWNGEGWIAVPSEFEEIVLKNAPYLDIIMKNGQIFDIIALEKPTPPQPEPTTDEILNVLLGVSDYE